MIIKLDQEAEVVKHGFFCVLAENETEATVINAYQSPNAKGWAEYAPFVSRDGQNWERIKPGKYDGKEFCFDVDPQAKFVCWYPPLKMQKIEEMGTAFKNVKGGGFFMGDPQKPTIVFLSGQHPGETMGPFFIEGVVEAVKQMPQIYEEFSFLVFPLLNLEGAKNMNYRFTPQGKDLNRSWGDEQPELKAIKEAIGSLKAVYAVVDVHGDEVSAKDYVIYDRSLSKKKDFKENLSADFVLLKRQNKFKKFIKNLVRKRKIIFERGKTARDYYAEKGFCAVTIELSAHRNTPEDCYAKAYNLIRRMNSRR